MGLDLTGLGTAFEFARGVMDRIWPPSADPNEKLKAQSALAEMMQARENQLLEIQKSIMVAELQQGDNYTKRARPTVVYMGLLFIALVYVIFPVLINIAMLFFIKTMTPEQVQTMQGFADLKLPGEFWAAWGGVVSIWSIGRTAERRGAVGKAIQAITGGK